MAWGLIAAALVGAGASVYGAKKASDASEDATQESIDLSREQFEQVREDTAPFRESSYNALNLLNAMVGLPAVGTPDAYGGGGSAVQRTEKATQGLSAIPGATWQGRQVFTDGKGGVYAPRGRNAGIDDLEYIGAATEKGIRPVGGSSRRFVRTDGGGVLSYRDGQFYAGRGRRAPAIDVAAPTPVEETPQAAVASGNALSPEEIMKRDPGYQFRLDEGVRAIDRYRSAKGGSLGGGALREITRYGQGYASNEYQNMYNRVSNIAGLGQVGVSQSNQAAMNFANTSANALNAQGYTRASAYTAGANAVGSAISDYASWRGYQSNQPTATSRRTADADIDWSFFD